MRPNLPLNFFLLLLFHLSLSAFTESPLHDARALPPPPPPNVTTGGESENVHYWNQHGQLLRSAWQEFGLADATLQKLSSLDIHPPLYHACEAAKRHPRAENEHEVRAQFHEVLPEVYTGSILTVKAIAKLRRELAHIASSSIPTRRPNGMNRFGLILDRDVDGGVANGVDSFVASLIELYVRPILQTMFPTFVGVDDATDFFAFTIQYNVSGDRSLAEHRDASVATLNLNLNTEREFEDGLRGSSLYFVDKEEDTRSSRLGDDYFTKKNQNRTIRKREVVLEPGMALLHRGGRRHAALPLIGDGMRQNLVIWLFGKDGYVRNAGYTEEERMTSEERWGIGSTTTDSTVATSSSRELRSGLTDL